MTGVDIDDLQIEEMDGASAPEADVRARWEMATVVDHELRPHVPPVSFDAYLARVRAVMPTDVELYWNVWDGDRRQVLGVAFLGYTTGPTNQHLAFGDVAVLSGHRRRGLGRRLLATVAERAQSLGRTTLLLDAPKGAQADTFLARRGFEVKHTVRLSRMPLATLDRSMLEQWVDRAGERAQGYSLLWFLDGVPDEHLDAYVKVGMVMNTAPRDDLDMEDWVDTPDEFRARYKLQTEEGWTSWRLVVRHDESGEFAGYTNVFFAPWTPGIAHQGGTAVDPRHRNKGLGRWLKAAMALKLLDERPDIAFVDTDNAESNDAMLAINVAMGFAELHVEQAWQARLDDVLSALA